MCWGLLEFRKFAVWGSGFRGLGLVNAHGLLGHEVSEEPGPEWALNVLDGSSLFVFPREMGVSEN